MGASLSTPSFSRLGPLGFHLAVDRTGALASWNLSANPARGGESRGVTCAGGLVTRLVLEELGLSGNTVLPALARLDGLRVLSLKGNTLSGGIPDLSPLTGLKLLFLASNTLSGTIPPSLRPLYRLDMSFNNPSDVVSPKLNRLDRLLTPRLDSNKLTGGVGAIALLRLQEFNVLNNVMSERIPAPLAAFDGNAGLCSAQLSPCKNDVQQPNASAARHCLWLPPWWRPHHTQSSWAPRHQTTARER